MSPWYQSKPKNLGGCMQGCAKDISSTNLLSFRIKRVKRNPITESPLYVRLWAPVSSLTGRIYEARKLNAPNTSASTQHEWHPSVPTTGRWKLAVNVRRMATHILQYRHKNADDVSKSDTTHCLSRGSGCP